MAPPTTERVESATSQCTNKKIRDATIERLARVIESPLADRSALIDRRLIKLNNEWDMERLLEFNASTLSLITMLLGYLHSSWWLLFTFVIGVFLCEHAIHGWCPPIPILRSIFGKRTSVEILSEKVALKMLRGDYQSVDWRTFEDGRDAKRLFHLADLHSHNDKRE